MLTVDYVKNENECRLEKVIINGILDEKSDGLLLNEVSASLHNEEIISILMLEKIEEIFKHFQGLDIIVLPKYYPKTISHIDNSRIWLFKDEERNEFGIEFSFEYDLESWAFNYSIKEICKRLEELCANSSYLNYKKDNALKGGFIIWKRYSDDSLIFGKLIEELADQIKLLFEEGLRSLNNVTVSNSFDFTFNITDGVKVACQQYLIYFTQFLGDIGIKASSQISDEAQKILFSVTPNNPEVALKQIKEALEVYLSLPNYSEELNANVGNEIAVLQLQSNVNHLKSQLALAKATMIAQEKTINLLEALSSNSLKDVNKVNEEELLGGIVKVTEYEKNGFKINVPCLLRKMKRRFDFKQ